MAFDYWSAGAALFGSLIGASATLAGIALTHKQQEKIRTEDLRRERRAIALAISAELELIAQQARVIQTVLERTADAGTTLAPTLLQNELIGERFYFSRLGDKVDRMPPEIISDIATSYTLCGTADAAMLRWIRQEEPISAYSLRTLAVMLNAVALRCSETANKLVRHTETQI